MDIIQTHSHPTLNKAILKRMEQRVIVGGDDGPHPPQMSGGADGTAVVTSTGKGTSVHDKSPISSVTIIITNYNTLRLVQRSIKTLRKVYPGVAIIVSDNNSRDGSWNYLKNLEGIRKHRHDKNIGHGPAMDYAIRNFVTTPYFFTLDTDTIILKGTFIEQMARKLGSDNNAYAIGWRRVVDQKSGVSIHWHVKKPPNPARFIQYVHPYAAMYDKEKYLTLPPFYHHGAPCLQNMREAVKRGYGLVKFPIKEFVQHLVAGTRRMYGGAWDVKDKAPGAWKANKSHPI